LVTESFLNSCFSVILNKESRVKKTNLLYRDILEIISFSENLETIQIPVTLQVKVDCLKKICQLLLTGKVLENVLDSISFSEKFNQYNEFLDSKVNEKLTEQGLQDTVRQIRIRKKWSMIYSNYDDLNKMIETIKDGSFDSIDDAVDDYEATIKTLYSNMMESDRATVIEAAASLDLLEDDYDHVVEMIKKKYDKRNKTSTGFPLLDNDVLYGGYEPSRLYVWGGGSGAGKSTLLNNSILKSSIIDVSRLDVDINKRNSGEIDKVYLYVTMENTIEEALMRTYMPLFDRTTVQMLQDIREGSNIKKAISMKLLENNSVIIMKYFPAMSVSVLDLMGVVDDVKEKYPGIKIAGLYVDYLDLLKADTRYDMYRLELGHITLALKTLAVQYNIPVITATQLGRSAYKIQESSVLSVDQISESIKKVEHADFVGLLAKDPVVDNLVHGKIGKNRSGKSNMSLDFKVDFSKFKFENVIKSSNREKPDATTKSECSFNFGGLGQF